MILLRWESRWQQEGDIQSLWFRSGHALVSFSDMAFSDMVEGLRGIYEKMRIFVNWCHGDPNANPDIIR